MVKAKNKENLLETMEENVPNGTHGGVRGRLFN